MAYVCLCRGINDTGLKEAFEKIREEKGGEDLTAKDAKDIDGGYQCGRCGPAFKKAVKQFNETGEVSTLKFLTGASESGGCVKPDLRDDSSPQQDPRFDLAYPAIVKTESAPSPE